LIKGYFKITSEHKNFFGCKEFYIYYDKKDKCEISQILSGVYLEKLPVYSSEKGEVSLSFEIAGDRLLQA
jgi:hypothetical protein